MDDKHSLIRSRFLFRVCGEIVSVCIVSREIMKINNKANGGIVTLIGRSS